MKFRNLLLVLALIGVLGCAKDRVRVLTDRADAFNRSIRWASLTAAGTLIKSENRRTVLEKLGASLADHRVVDYSIVDLGVDPEKRNASVLVEYSYYGVNEGDLQFRQEVQSWTYIRSERTWYLTNMTPVTAK